MHDSKSTRVRNLSELVLTKPRLEAGLEVAELDRLLEDEELFIWIKVSLSKRHPNTEGLAREMS